MAFVIINKILTYKDLRENFKNLQRSLTLWRNLYTVISSNLLVLHISRSIFLRPASFLRCFKFFLRNCPSLISRWFSIILVVLYVISGEFPSRFLKCYFYFWSLSSWLSAFSITLMFLFFPLSSFTVCHAEHDCLYSTKFLILEVLPLYEF